MQREPEIATHLLASLWKPISRMQIRPDELLNHKSNETAIFRIGSNLARTQQLGSSNEILTPEVPSGWGSHSPHPI